MTQGHRLHEARIEGRGVEPAGAFSVEVIPAPGGVTVLALAGELDMAAAPTVRANIDAAVSARALVLDVSDVTFVDSSMLKELLRAAAEFDRYETLLVLAGMPESVRRLFDLTKTAELFTHAPDRETALRSLQG
jgi:anti-sigma B factor antagonist